jgi:signal transduction histidine kinase
VVNDLLTLSRLDADDREISFEDFDVQEVIRRCVINLERFLEDKVIDLDIRFCSEFLYVHANKNSIEMVLYNLLHNAIKFSHPKGVIRIITTVEGKLAGITVEDFGIGIQPEELENIWDRFYTVDKSRSMNGTGTGLGLSIIKNVMEKHHQPITVESQPGIGTKFFFTLPLSRK